MPFKFLEEPRPPDCIADQSAVRELKGKRTPRVKENEGNVLRAYWGHEGPCAQSTWQLEMLNTQGPLFNRRDQTPVFPPRRVGVDIINDLVTF